MKRKGICELLDIKYPIIQGGMGWISNAELAAAVSNAGGLGVISPVSGPREKWPENLRAQIRKAKQLTNKAFGVNVSLEFGQDMTEMLLDVIKDEHVKAIVTSMGNPSYYRKHLKDAGIKIMHLVFSPRHARRAEADGMDAVIASGIDAGGHLSYLEAPTFALVPQVVDAVNLPVIAAGGIADGRGLVAALALGASGVQIGTRFAATKECIAHPLYKQAILNGSCEDTVVTGRGSKVLVRALKNDLTSQVLQMEGSGASGEEIYNFIGPGRVRMGVMEGNLKEGTLTCSAAIGLIKDIPTVQEVVQRIMQEASPLVKNLSNFLEVYG